MATDTRAKLLEAASSTLRDRGIAGVSARTIATAAGVNQALIFYHFHSVAELVDAACRQAVDERLDFYREQFAAVGSLPQLLEVGRGLHERDQAAGNVTTMAQLMAGAQRDATLAAAARYAMTTWSAAIEDVITRLLAASPLAEIADPDGLAKAVSAAFIGLELYDGVDSAAAQRALDALEGLGSLVEVVDDLGPVARRALRAKVRRRQKRRE